MSLPVTPSIERKPQADAHGKLVTPTPIENTAFVNSQVGRTARLVAEFAEFPHRVAQTGVRGTFLFFGSARAMSPGAFQAQKSAFEESLKTTTDEDVRSKVTAKLAIMKPQEWMCKAYDATEELARLLTEWARSPEGQMVGCQMTTKFPSIPPHPDQPLVVCTGGGPGFMEAGNKGASKVPGGISMGVAVTLPFEKHLNPYVTPGLNFRMEYFFTRKFWEVYAAKAMICAPGGMGTCDEMFEVLTLMQVGHCPKMPVVLLGEAFWRDCIQFDKFAQYGVISQHEVDALCFTDDPIVAFEFIRKALVADAHANTERSQTPVNS
jgi:uncharacterized protein (TIGR00730 family)